MDEGAGDQLENGSSNLQQLLLEKNTNIKQSSSLNDPSSSLQQNEQSSHHQQQPPLSSSSSSSTTSSFNNHQSNNILTASSQQLLLQQHQQHQQRQEQHPSSLETKLTTMTTTTQQHNINQQLQQDQSNNSNIKTSEEPQDRANQKHQQQQNSNNGHLPKRNPTEDLFSNEKWGTTPIRQDTPWELPPSPTQTSNNGSTVNSSGNNNSNNNGASNNSSSIINSNNNTTSTSSSNSNNSAAVGLLGSAGGVLAGSNPSGPTTLPPGISHSGDSFRSGASVNDFHGHAEAMINNFGMESMAANGLANSLGHMNLGGGGGGVLPSRFDQPWRAPAAKNPPSMATNSSPFANHNLMTPQSMKSMPNSGAGGGNGGSSYVGMQQSNEFARAPGPATSIMDYNMTQPKPFGMANRSSTWSAFGSPAPNEPEPGWPKTSSSGISSGNSTQPSNAFDLVPEFEPGKSWRGSMLMKGLDDEPTMNSGSAGISAFANAYGSSSKSPPGSQYELSGIGTWAPISKGGRPGSKWDSDGPENERGDNGRFDDGTAIWGSPAQSKAVGVDWVEKSGDANSNMVDKSRSSAGNNQTYRPQQQQQQQSSQANQPNRGPPSNQQLKHMVHQIQLAVQAGHLNPQILNQPLAPETLQLLYQLLQQIRNLHQLQMPASQQLSKLGNHPANVNVHITKTKQNILSLQNQIAAQQAVYLKTQTHNISSRQQTMPNLATGGAGVGIVPALPPGISQSGDSFRSGASVNNFHGQATAMMNMGINMDSMSANGLGGDLGHMNLGGGGVLPSRFDQPWRAPAAKNPSSMVSSPFANHNLMTPQSMKSMPNSGAGGGNGGSSYVGMQQSNEFARAPGPATSIMDYNMTQPKPFGMANRSSTWSAFGSPAPNEPEPGWPKTSSSGISSGNSTQPSNAFDLVPEFEPGKPWRGSMLMKSVEDDPTMTPGSMARSLAPQRKTIWSDEIL